MIKLSWRDEILKISDPRLAGRSIDVWYIEAFCRGNSANRAWEKTVISHKTSLVAEHLQRLHLRSTLSDGVIVDHHITAAEDEISFDLQIANPTSADSEVQWAQPCIRVAEFCGVEFARESEAYLPKCFIFIDGQEHRLPTDPWNRSALYSPGQVWPAPGINPRDVNPRPLNAYKTSDGLIGCHSADEQLILATAWEPYQELFQGVFCCLHSDFAIGGVEFGEQKNIRGKIYLVEADIPGLLGRYAEDFPQQQMRPE